MKSKSPEFYHQLVTDYLKTSNDNLLSFGELVQQAKTATSIFEEYDKDASLTIDSNELESLLLFLGDPNLDSDLDMARDEMDEDGNGVIEFQEWIVWWLERAGKNPNADEQAKVRTLKKSNKSPV